MKLLRAATLSVASLERSLDVYQRWLDFTVEEVGPLDAELANSWSTPGAAGRARSCGPHPVATSSCVSSRTTSTPITCPCGPTAGRPSRSAYRMYSPPTSGCWTRRSKSSDWCEKHARLAVGRRKLEIVYTMLAKAYGLPEDDLHVVATMIHGRDVFLEMDQYPPAATVRPGKPGELPKGVAVGTFIHPDFDAIEKDCANFWIARPTTNPSCVYGGGRAGTLAAPDGALIELVSMPDD